MLSTVADLAPALQYVYPRLKVPFCQQFTGFGFGAADWNCLEWSAAEIMGHILETDRLFVLRAQALLNEQGAELPMPKVPWKLHEGKGYEEMEPTELLEHLREARTQSLELIRNLAPEDWLRRGLNFGTKISMLDLATWLANHDRGHLAQIKRLCAP